MRNTWDKSKTLEQLENDVWEEPDNQSNLMATVIQLRRKPLNEFTVEDLRMTIGQGVGLTYLIPLALEKLQENPFISGDYYRGDLLKQVLSVEGKFWDKHEELYWELEIILGELETLKDTIENELTPAMELFRGKSMVI